MSVRDASARAWCGLAAFLAIAYGLGWALQITVALSIRARGDWATRPDALFSGVFAMFV